MSADGSHKTRTFQSVFGGGSTIAGFALPDDFLEPLRARWRRDFAIEVAVPEDALWHLAMALYVANGERVRYVSARDARLRRLEQLEQATTVIAERLPPLEGLGFQEDVDVVLMLRDALVKANVARDRSAAEAEVIRPFVEQAKVLLDLCQVVRLELTSLPNKQGRKGFPWYDNLVLAGANFADHVGLAVTTQSDRSKDPHTPFLAIMGYLESLEPFAGEGLKGGAVALAQRVGRSLRRVRPGERPPRTPARSSISTVRQEGAD